MSERILQGPFLVRGEAARNARVSPWELVHRPDLLRVTGPWSEEVYFAFQFDDDGVRHDLGRIVMTLRTTMDDLTIADWLIRPNAALGSEAPLHWLGGGRAGDRLRLAVEDAAEPTA